MTATVPNDPLYDADVEREDLIGKIESSKEAAAGFLPLIGTGIALSLAGVGVLNAPATGKENGFGIAFSIWAVILVVLGIVLAFLSLWQGSGDRKKRAGYRSELATANATYRRLERATANTQLQIAPTSPQAPDPTAIVISPPSDGDDSFKRE